MTPPFICFAPLLQKWKLFSLGYNMEGLDFKRTLKTKICRLEVVKRIEDKISAIPNISSLRLDTELTLFIARCIESEMISKTEEEKEREWAGEKKELLLAILGKIHALDRNEIPLVEGQIEFLLSNKRIVKNSRLKYFFNCFGSWVSRKIL